MTCTGCGKALPEATSRRRYCGPVCRAKAWRKRRDEEVREGLDQVARGLEKAREALAAREQKGRRR